MSPSATESSCSALTGSCMGSAYRTRPSPHSLRVLANGHWTKHRNQRTPTDHDRRGEPSHVISPSGAAQACSAVLFARRRSGSGGIGDESAKSTTRPREGIEPGDLSRQGPRAVHCIYWGWFCACSQECSEGHSF